MDAIEVEKRLAVLASGQWGLVTAPQAVAEGVSYSQLNRLADREVITRLAHGVYRLRSAPLDRHIDLRAAWLALDPKRTAGQRLQDPTTDAVVSHASAATFRGWGDLTAYDSEFTFDGRKQSRRTDVRLHRGSTPMADIEIVDGLPVSTADRLVTDLLAAHHDLDHVADVLAGAIRAGRVDPDRLAERIAPFGVSRGLVSSADASFFDVLVRAGGVQDEVLALHVKQLVALKPDEAPGLAAAASLAVSGLVRLLMLRGGTASVLAVAAEGILALVNEAEARSSQSGEDGEHGSISGTNVAVEAVTDVDSTG